MDKRFNLMQVWLESLDELKHTTYSQPQKASSDASFRRYFRIDLANQLDKYSAQSLIIMDAPPENENSTAFISVSKQLKSIGLNVPVVIAKELRLGFLLLTDLGKQTYLSVLDEKNAEKLYSQALTSLVTMQVRGSLFVNELPIFDGSILQNEMAMFNDWLGEKHLNLGMNKLEKIGWQDLQKTLIKSALKQPQVLVHRDYHSRNLMYIEQNNPGILDFQDALKGGLTYDAVSMLKDCYISWDEQQVEQWTRQYFLMLCSQNITNKNQWQGFQESFELMGVQRHLKAAGIFARLYHRDGKENYLNDIPTTLNYLTKTANKYSKLSFLSKWIEQKILPRL